jgi:phenylacetic acid degradation operon negative regulatory protein
MFPLGTWSSDARRLTAALTAELDAGPPDDHDANEVLRYHFTLSIAVVRHLQLDPLLPVELLPDDWPANDLRTTYRAFDHAFKRQLGAAQASS